MGLKLPSDVERKCLELGGEVTTHPDPPKTRKYRNEKTTAHGIVFDSKKEAERWGILLLLQKAGVIRDLERQRRFRLEVNGELICTYVSDFSYIEVKTGLLVVEDTKSAFTRKLPVYRIKKKLLRALLGIAVQEV